MRTYLKQVHMAGAPRRLNFYRPRIIRSMISVVTQLARLCTNPLFVPPCPNLCAYLIQIKQTPVFFPIVFVLRETHPLQAKGEVQSREQADAENGALAGADLLLGEALEHVVAQMAHAVDEVEDEGEAEAELDEALEGKGEGGEAGDEALRLNVEAGEGGDQVGEEVGVRGAGQGAAGDARPGRGGEPRLRALVDAEMGRDGAQEALLGEDVLALGGCEGGGLDGAALVGVLVETTIVSISQNVAIGDGVRDRVFVVEAYRAWVVEMRAAWARRGMFWLMAARKKREQR